MMYMATYEGEVASLLDETGASFRAVRRNYSLEANYTRPGETVFTALGEYAICQPDNNSWQLLSEEQWAEVQHFRNPSYPGQWATAEELRTWASIGTFLPEHMDLLDASLFREQRKTSSTTRLTVADEADLHELLANHDIPTNNWPTSVRRLYNDINPEGKENISLHSVGGDLWLSTAQTMVNLYHTDNNGKTYKLRETDIIHVDEQGNHQPPIKSKLRSSLGETGHIIKNCPERPYSTARRGLREELGLKDKDIINLVSLGSLLRVKENGHHKFNPIKAEDRTHYFRAMLSPQAVRPEYTNKEYDADGKLSALIKLEWFIEHDSR